MIGFTMMPGKGDTDLLLSALVTELQAKGVLVCGCVQTNEEQPGQHVCDMLVRAVPSGNVYKISQDLGKGSRGCRLDANALEAAVADVTAAFEQGAEVLIINKFGKHEAQGRGFRDLIAEAVMREVPVLVGLNDLNYQAFLEFAGDLAVPVEPNPEDLLIYIQNTLAGRNLTLVSSDQPTRL
jgi:nucleoside-triphosphatase THEP1